MQKKSLSGIFSFSIHNTKIKKKFPVLSNNVTKCTLSIMYYSTYQQFQCFTRSTKIFILVERRAKCWLELLCAALCEKKTTGTVQTSCIFFLSHPLAIEIGGGRACSPPTFDVKKKKRKLVLPFRASLASGDCSITSCRSENGSPLCLEERKKWKF